MKQYWRLIRGEHGVLTAISSAASYLVAGGKDPISIVVLGVSAFLAEAGLFAHNDIANISEDRINRPDAPLVTGDVSIKAAWAVALGSYALGLTLSLFLSWTAALIYLTAIVLGSYYNAQGKRVPFLGNFIVAFLTSMVYPYGMAAARSLSYILVLLFTASFLANFGRELVKTAIDYWGDAAAGLKTAATTLGPEAAAKIGAYFALASSVVGAYLAYLSAKSGLVVLAIGVSTTTIALVVLAAMCITGKWQLFRKGSLAAFGATLLGLFVQGLLAIIFT